MSKSTSIHIGLQMAVDSWSLVTEDTGGLCQEVGPSPTLPAQGPLAGFPSPLALDSGMSTSLAAAPTTILGHFMGPTVANGRKPNFLPQEMVQLVKSIFKD